jgi:cephalosporin hydroxylase
MSSLEQYFRKNKGRLIHKYHHYFDIYERHFQKYRNKKVVILEIGIFQGGSLQMWKEYFGKNAEIYGIDINPQCKAFEEKNINIFIGSQSDRKFLREVKRKIPKVDILIDDGGHFMKQQIITFEEMYDHVKEDGIYLCEDLHTSYWLRYGVATDEWAPLSNTARS